MPGEVYRAFSLPTCSGDRKSTRLNSSHTVISYAVFCLKKKKKNHKSRHASNSNAQFRSKHNTKSLEQTKLVLITCILCEIGNNSVENTKLSGYLEQRL